jgi:hypothetical protein
MGKPADRIIGISTLGQAVMAIGLGRPDDARARPSSLLSNPTNYDAVFTSKISLDLYLWIAATQRKIDTLLRSEDIDTYSQTNLRFHIGMYLVMKRFGARVYSPGQLADLSKEPFDVGAKEVREALDLLLEWADQVGDSEGWPLDRVAKSKSFVDDVVELALGK